MGKVQKKLGRLHDALASFNQALDLDPKSGNMIKAHIDRLQVCWHMFCLHAARQARMRIRTRSSYLCMC